MGYGQRWDLDLALARLGVELVEFDSGGRDNSYGWSRVRRRRNKPQIAISPRAPLPQDFIAFHELGHLLMGHHNYCALEFSLALGDAEAQAMTIAVMLAEDLLADSAHLWRDYAQQYINNVELIRYRPKSDEEDGMIREAVEIIRRAGVGELVAA